MTLTFFFRNDFDGNYLLGFLVDSFINASVTTMPQNFLHVNSVALYLFDGRNVFHGHWLGN